MISEINMDPLLGSALLQIESGLCRAMVDYVLGQTGRTPPLTGELTGIEIGIIETFLINLLGTLREAWVGVIDLRPRLGHIETDATLTSIAPPETWIAVFGWEVRTKHTSGRFHLMYDLRPLGSLYKYIKRDSYPVSSGAIELEDMPLRMEVSLAGEAVIDGAQLRALQPGDTILLGEAGQADLIVLNAADTALACGRLDQDGKIRDVILRDTAMEPATEDPL